MDAHTDHQEAMNDPANHPKKKIAWNGLSIKVPTNWEIDSIERDHLIIGRNDIQQIEIKWIKRPRRYSLTKFVKKFVVQSQKQLHIQIHEAATPEHFIPENPDFDFFFFDWESRTGKGRGVLLLCRHCHRLTIIRFFKSFKWHNAPMIEAILQSVRDHSETGICQWAVFGMHFSAPDFFALERFRFNPGLFEIHLQYKRNRLSLYSWGPASFLLSNKSLSAFARQQIKLPPTDNGLTELEDGCTLQWEFRNKVFEKMALPEPIDGWMDHTLFKITHAEKQNRIIGILIDAPRIRAHDIIRKVLI